MNLPTIVHMPFIYYDDKKGAFAVFPRRSTEVRDVNGEKVYELELIVSCEYVEGQLRKIDFGEQFFPTLEAALKYAFSLSTTALLRPKFTRKLIPVSDELQAIEAILNCTDEDYSEYWTYMGVI